MKETEYQACCEMGLVAKRALRAEGGDGGGTIVATGTPEEVCTVPESITGQFLAPILERDRARMEGRMQ